MYRFYERRKTMTNLILLIALIVVGWGSILGKPSKGRLFAGLGIIGAIMLFVAGRSAMASDFGPMIGIGAFVGTFALVYALRKSKS
jgi:hypothetical protein